MFTRRAPALMSRVPAVVLRRLSRCVQLLLEKCACESVHRHVLACIQLMECSPNKYDELVVPLRSPPSEARSYRGKVIKVAAVYTNGLPDVFG